MKLNIYLIGGFLYNEKDSQGNKTDNLKFRLTYFYSDREYRKNDSKFKGFKEMSAYLPSRVADDIPVEWYGSSVIAHISSKPSERDPLRENKFIEFLEKGDIKINLV